MNKKDWLIDYKELDSKVSKLFNLVLGKLPSTSADKIDIIIIGLLKRIVNNYNAVNLLFENGMYLESLMIIRSIIEATFIFNGFMEKPAETYDKLLLLSHNNKKELHKKALRYENMKEKVEKYNFDELEAKYISIKKFSNMSSKNYSLYNIAYKMISDDVHINLFSIEKLIVLRGDNTFDIKENLDEKDIDEAYFTFIYCVYMIGSGLNKNYLMELDDEFKEIEKLLEKIN
ncbi:DUF5677 domain-containing protein [Clostridiaceae bacterium HSG29]|nr:DUF5677 domain-containing protein [Clostridiaceae bacterium HSG29]